MTPSEIEPATFWLVAQCLNQLRYRVPRISIRINVNLRTNLRVKENVAPETLYFNDTGFCRRYGQSVNKGIFSP